MASIFELFEYIDRSQVHRKAEKGLHIRTSPIVDKKEIRVLRKRIESNRKSWEDLKSNIFREIYEFKSVPYRFIKR